MKLRLLTAIVLISFLHAGAQPVIHSVTNFVYGLTFRFVDCQTAGFNPGGAGASQVWNFASLTATDTAIDICRGNTHSIHPEANLIVTEDLLNDTFYYNVQSTGSYLLGNLYPTSGYALTYQKPIFYRRVLTYNDTYVDTFAFTGVSPTQSGYGVDSVLVDGYGSLTLPIGTYSNVIRIKAVSRYADTVSAIPTDFVSVIYYWYDDAHMAPLLEWDSVYNVVTTPNVLRYMLRQDYPSAVEIMATRQPNATAGFIGNNLVVNGNFETGASYEIAIYNISGQRIYVTSRDFQGTSFNLNTGANIVPGMYLINIVNKAMPTERSMLKVVKTPQ